MLSPRPPRRGFGGDAASVAARLAEPPMTHDTPQSGPAGTQAAIPDVPVLLEWLDARGEEMAELVAALVAIESENPPGRALGRCGRLLHDAMTRLGLAPELIELPPRPGLEEPCIVRGSAGEGPGHVYFHGHFDVVPAQSPEQFRAAARATGRIIGRGSADMKGGIVSMLYGAAAARELGLLGGGRIALHLVCDEETGSVAGSGHLREAGMIDAGALAMLTAEPTGGVVWHASRGAITLRVGVRAALRTSGRRISASTRSADAADRGAARRPRARAARAPHGIHGRERGGAGVGARRRRRLGQRRQLQRRARVGLVLGRPALQPRGGSRARRSRC